MLANWDSKYETKISEIDSQHKQLFHLINNIEDVYENHKAHLSLQTKVLLDAVSALEDYTLSHFLIEERVMEHNQYPDLEAHIAQHNQFTDKILELKNRLGDTNLLSDDKGLEIFLKDLVEFLRSWLTNHILVKDMDYKPFIKFSL
jgi:hemerythrin